MVLKMNLHSNDTMRIPQLLTKVFVIDGEITLQISFLNSLAKGA